MFSPASEDNAREEDLKPEEMFIEVGRKIAWISISAARAERDRDKTSNATVAITAKGVAERDRRNTRRTFF